MHLRLAAWFALISLWPAFVANADEGLRFNDFPAAARHPGRNAVPVLSSKEAWQFRTIIRNAAREMRPNFDGHYIVIEWGCGTDCSGGAIIDAVTGRVTMLPVVAGIPADAEVNGDPVHFTFGLDSRLFMITGEIGEEPPMGSHYFEFDGRRLKHLKTVARPGRQPTGK